MPEALLQHIRRLVTIADEEYLSISKFFKSRSVGKKQNLLKEGQVCASQYFVITGCLRLFFINDKGVEQTIQFALENWWMADYASFNSRHESAFFIQAVEASEVLEIDFNQQELLLEKHPVMERYFRLIHQRAHAASQFRIKTLYSLSREEMYRMFIEKYPEFVQRIPQYLLASFLGFTPEYLSEIRKKKLS